MANTLQQMVDREVIYCVSTLISDLAKKFEFEYDHLFLGPADCEEDALFSGWEHADGVWTKGNLVALTAEEACILEDIDVHYAEVYEHWIVSEWLGRKLRDRGETVDFDVHGMTVWARTTTGQSVDLDYVIEEIHRDLISGRG